MIGNDEKRILSALRQTETRMRQTGSMMIASGDDNMARHGAELLEAASMVAGWVKGIVGDRISDD